MQLHGINFGSIANSSGARGWYGEGYAFHKLWRPFGLDYSGSTFVAKTTTLNGRPGNMPLNSRYQPKELIPKCIVVRFKAGVTLNAVGLSGPPARELFKKGLWQQIDKPFFLSFMSTESNPRSRTEELRQFIDLLGEQLASFKAKPGLQINFSCPNINLNPSELIKEIDHALELAGQLGIPLIPKLSAIAPIAAVLSASQHPNFSALCMSNTIPWGQLPDKINWLKLFGSPVSPLRKRGFQQDGGLSGKPLLPIVCDWIKHARDSGLDKPIIGCGGILHPVDVKTMIQAGANSIEIGCVSILRPWRVQAIIRQAQSA